MMKISQNGINLIKHYEQCRLQTYRDATGTPTIGWGHTGKDVRMGMTITQSEADRLLTEDLARFVNAVNTYANVPLSQNQFDALVSFTYNCGEGNLRTSTLLRKLNSKDYKGAAAEFPRWNRSKGKILKGLINRRAAEQALFLK
jgi:lysozyme